MQCKPTYFLFCCNFIKNVLTAAYPSRAALWGPSDTLVFDLQFRVGCKGCNRWSDLRITIFDTRTRGDNSKPRLERVIVAGE